MKAKTYYQAAHIRCFQEDGVEVRELFPGLHQEVRAFKISMRAGSSFAPALYEDYSVLNIFGNINGADGFLQDAHGQYQLNTTCFYAPNYAKEPYTVHAVTELEFVQVLAHMDSHDLDDSIDTVLALPFFRRESQCERYDQDCKTAGTISRTVLFGEFDRLGRLTCGICEARNGNGTIEAGHEEVDQWNYAIAGADYWMKTGAGDQTETVRRVAGDWDYIPAGLDHTLFADHGKYLHYVWVEFNTHKRGK